VLVGQRHDRPGAPRGGADQGTGQGRVFQISAAYSPIVRSLEKRPEPAMLSSALRAHSR